VSGVSSARLLEARSQARHALRTPQGAGAWHAPPQHRADTAITRSGTQPHEDRSLPTDSHAASTRCSVAPLPDPLTLCVVVVTMSQ